MKKHTAKILSRICDLIGLLAFLLLLGIVGGIEQDISIKDGAIASAILLAVLYACVEFGNITYTIAHTRCRARKEESHGQYHTSSRRAG